MEAPLGSVVVFGIVLDIHIAAGLAIKAACFLTIQALHLVYATANPSDYLLIIRFGG
jgi:hypothetical protein